MRHIAPSFRLSRLSPSPAWPTTLFAAVLAFVSAAALVIAMVASVLELRPGHAVAAVALPSATQHRLMFQVSIDDMATMLHVIASADSAVRAYRSRHEPVAVEIVATGPGVHMLRSDTSPVRDALHELRTDDPEVTLSACGTTKAMMEEREGHAVTMLDGVRVVPAGIVRLVELEEQGWSSVRP